MTSFGRTCQNHNRGRTECVGKRGEKSGSHWPNRICNDNIHPRGVSAEQVHEDMSSRERQTDRMTYKSQGGRRGRPWRWWGRRGWHLPLSTLLYLHWTPHPGGWIKHTHIHNEKQHTGIARYLVSCTLLQTWDWSPSDSFRVSLLTQTKISRLKTSGTKKELQSANTVFPA